MIPKIKVEALCEKYSEVVPEYGNKNLFFDCIKILTYIGFVG